MDYYNGVVKVKDGLYIGNTETGEDLEFLTNNKITRIINCAALEQCSIWESSGIKYLSFTWHDNLVQIIFDNDDTILNELCEFIDSALNNGESCLIWSVNGISRCTCVAAGYLMNKYSWGLYKTLDYLNSRKSNLNLNPNFVHQLVLLQRRLMEKHDKRLSFDWREPQDLENLVLRNTYLNAKISEKTDYDDEDIDEKDTSLSWADNSIVQENRTRFEGNLIVTRSCFKGQQSKLFTFECKKVEPKLLKVPVRKSQTPIRSFIRKGKSPLNNQENVVCEYIKSQKDSEKRPNSLRPASPAIALKRPLKPYMRPWK